MGTNLKNIRRGAAIPAYRGLKSLAVVFGCLALVMAFALPLPSPAALTAPASEPAPGKVLEELHYQVDVWIWSDAVRARLVFREVGPGRYLAELNGQSQGLLSMLSGNWRGSLSTEMEYTQKRLQPLVYREIAYKKGKKRVMEYRFDYAGKKVELWKTDDSGNLAKRWETTLTGPMYDPLTFFYNRRLTGAAFDEKGGAAVKFQGIPYPKPDDITLRVGDKTPEGRKIMLEMGSRLFKDERSQVYAYLDADGVPTKAWTQVMKFGNVDIKLLPGGRRLNKAEVTGAQGQARASRD